MGRCPLFSLFNLYSERLTEDLVNISSKQLVSSTLSLHVFVTVYNTCREFLVQAMLQAKFTALLLAGVTTLLLPEQIWSQPG